MKQRWDKPEMIVLVRRRSDEIILANCKDSGGGVAIANGTAINF